MKKKISKNKGFLQIVILAIVAIAILAYFNIDLRTIFSRPEVQKIWNILLVVWGTYLKPMFAYLYISISGLFVK